MGLQIHRWVFRLTRRHWRRNDMDGFIARRLLEGVPPTAATFDQWQRDLRHMIVLAFERMPDGQYASIRTQGAALRLQHLLDTLDAETFVDQMKKERAA
jgi:hypothetical protein